jgi:cytochrome c oxidase subunit IV
MDVGVLHVAAAGATGLAFSVSTAGVASSSLLMTAALAWEVVVVVVVVVVVFVVVVFVVVATAAAAASACTFILPPVKLLRMVVATALPIAARLRSIRAASSC